MIKLFKIFLEMVLESRILMEFEEIHVKGSDGKLYWFEDWECFESCGGSISSDTSYFVFDLTSRCLFFVSFDPEGSLQYSKV